MGRRHLVESGVLEFDAGRSFHLETV